MSKTDGGRRHNTQNIKGCAATSDKTRGTYSRAHSAIGGGDVG